MRFTFLRQSWLPTTGGTSKACTCLFNFSLLETRWHARTLATLIDEYEGALPPGSWPNWVLGNHDRPRIASRVGPAQARVAAMLLGRGSAG